MSSDDRWLSLNSVESMGSVAVAVVTFALGNVLVVLVVVECDDDDAVTTDDFFNDMFLRMGWLLLLLLLLTGRGASGTTVPADKDDQVIALWLLLSRRIPDKMANDRHIAMSEAAATTIIRTDLTSLPHRLLGLSYVICDLDLRLATYADDGLISGEKRNF